MNQTMRACAAVLCLTLAGCGGDGKPQVYYPEPVTSTEGGAEDGKAKEGPVHLSTVQVKAVEPPDDADAAASLEEAIAFNHIGVFVECEKAVPEGDLAEGTIVVQFGVDAQGAIIEEPSVVLTTSSAEGPLEECLRGAFDKIDFSSVVLSGDHTFHLILKFSK
jgi:hypothetical protein